MTSKEKELLTLIRESENPEQAFVTAILAIGYALGQPVPYQAPSVDARRGLA